MDAAIVAARTESPNVNGTNKIGKTMPMGYDGIHGQDKETARIIY